MEFPEESLQRMMERNGEVKIVHLKGNEASRKGISETLTNILTFEPFHVFKFQLYSLIELIRFKEYLKDCDLVFVEGALIPFGIILSKIFKKRIILDTHCINKLLARYFKNRNPLVYFARKILWDLLERFATRISNVVITVSKVEREFVAKEYGISKSKIFVVPNVIQIESECSSKAELSNIVKKGNSEAKVIVTFVGDLETVQNKDAANYIINELAPFFWKKRKDVLFLIVGRVEKSIKQKLPNLIFTEFVKNLSPWLEFSDVCIAPLRVGAGVKTKILAYIVSAKPVVTTPIGVEGIEVDKLDSIIVTDITQFADTLLKALDRLQDLKQKAKKNVKIAKSICAINITKPLKRALEYACTH
jgi:glycosyltransferase involved in cell wall biosynthesis